MRFFRHYNVVHCANWHFPHSNYDKAIVEISVNSGFYVETSEESCKYFCSTYKTI